MAVERRLEARSRTPGAGGTLSLRCRRVRENIAELVNDFLPDLIFEKVVITRSAQRSGFQDFVLLVKQFVEFEPHLLAAMVCHSYLCDVRSWRKGQAAFG